MATTTTMTPPTNIPTTFRTFTDPDSLQPSSSSSTFSTNHPSEDLVFPNPAISVISAVTRHAKRTCKQLTSFHRHHHRHEKAPDMAKMKLVTPVYDHISEKWVWPDNVSVDDDEEDKAKEDRRRERRSQDRNELQSTLFATSIRTYSSGRSSSRG